MPIRAFRQALCAAVAESVSDWASEFVGRPSIVIDQSGEQVSEGVAAWLRHAGASSADVLAGGHLAWVKQAARSFRLQKCLSAMPSGERSGSRAPARRLIVLPVPWLIRRFVDPAAIFLFVAPAEVSAVAERFGGAPFDIEGAFWSHRGERCTFDTMLEEWGLAIEPLQRLAVIVRGADTARLDLAPEAAGLLAASLGQSRMYADDLEQLKAGMALYDAFYRWCRDATDEPHNWPATKSGKAS